MNQLNVRSYTLRYFPLFALGWFIVMLWTNGQQLIDAFNHEPILLKGLGGVKLSLLMVEVAVILCSSLVVGIATSFVCWIFGQERLTQDQR